MERTEIREINGYRVGFNLDSNSYYPIGDPQFDPNYQENVKNRNDPTLPVLIGAVIESQEGDKFAAPVLEFSKQVEDEPELEYQWFEGNSPAHVETEIPGATNPEYVPDEPGKFVKVSVTAISGATGTVVSNAKKTVANLL